MYFGIFLDFWIEVNLCQEGSKPVKGKGSAEPFLSLTAELRSQNCTELCHPFAASFCAATMRLEELPGFCMCARLEVELMRLGGPGKHLTKDGRQLTRSRISSSRE